MAGKTYNLKLTIMHLVKCRLLKKVFKKLDLAAHWRCVHVPASQWLWK